MKFSLIPWNTSVASNALEGVHGVHVVPHSTFSPHQISQQGDCNPSSDGSVSNGGDQNFSMQQIRQQRLACLRPLRGSLDGDLHLGETIANVLTSLPFIVLGIHAPRKNLNSMLYANSLIGVGVACTIYHCSRGQMRRYLRKVDYTMIATATLSISRALGGGNSKLLYCSILCATCLSRALRGENPKLLMAASAFLLPFKPFMVSAVHTGMMEVAFARRASAKPELRTAHNLHKMSSLLGGAFFIADDLFPETPFIHAAWHLAAAIGVGTCNKLLE